MADAFESILVAWLAFVFLPEKPTRSQGGTDGSNPLSSTGESYELAGRDRYRFTARQQRGQQPSPLAKGADQDPASPDLALRAQ